MAVGLSGSEDAHCLLGSVACAPHFQRERERELCSGGVTMFKGYGTSLRPPTFEDVLRIDWGPGAIPTIEFDV